MREVRVKSIFCPGGFTYDNKGDGLLVLALLAQLKEAFPGASYTVASFTPLSDQKRYGVTVVEPLVSPNTLLLKAARWSRRLSVTVSGVGYGVAAVWLLVALRAWLMLHGVSPGLARRLLPPEKRRHVAAALDADLIVGVPGGYLMARSPSSGDWLSHMITLALPVMAGKPVVLSPCSIGPFEYPHDRLASWLLTRVRLIVVREERSAQELQRIGVRTEVVQAPDAAFSYHFSDEQEWVRQELTAVGVASDDTVIGVSVRHHEFPGHPDPKRAFDSYLAAVADTMDAVARDRPRVRFIFVPQCIDRGGDDVAVARLVHQRLAPTTAATILTSDYTVDQLGALYSQFSMLIGTRMHANIIALRRGTPVVAIAYEHKTTKIMAQLGLSAYAVEIDQIHPAHVAALCRAIGEDPDAYIRGMAAPLADLEARASCWLDQLSLLVES